MKRRMIIITYTTELKRPIIMYHPYLLSSEEIDRSGCSVPLMHQVGKPVGRVEPVMSRAAVRCGGGLEHSLRDKRSRRGRE